MPRYVAAYEVDKGIFPILSKLKGDIPATDSRRLRAKHKIVFCNKLYNPIILNRRPKPNNLLFLCKLRKVASHEMARLSYFVNFQCGFINSLVSIAADNTNVCKMYTLNMVKMCVKDF